MPVIHSQKNKGWVMQADLSEAVQEEIIHIGIFGPSTELHYHDFNEYWYVLQGTAKVVTEGQEHEVKVGGFIITMMGDEHSCNGSLDFKAMCIGGKLRGKKRHGHLHRSQDD